MAAVSASLGLALLEKVLRIIHQKKDFEGDPERLNWLLDQARAASVRLAGYADEDISAFNAYMACRQLAKDTAPEREERKRAMDAALMTAIEVPLKIARSAMAGLDLCASAGGFVHAFVAADLGAAAELLAGAVRATLLSVDFNLGQLSRESQFYRDAVRERDELRTQVLELGKSL